MSKTVDERVVEMRFDNKQFERNIESSISALDHLKQKLDLPGAAKGLENVEKAAKTIDFAPLSKAVDTVKVRFSALEVMAVTALTNITNSIVNTGRQMLRSLAIEPISQGFGEYELKMGSVQTIMASTGETLETVNGYLNELNTYADRTIYSFSDMTSNIGKFTNSGVALKDAVKAIQGISNEAAVSGANANEASRAMYNFAQALSTGAVKLIDWKSIENANMATVEFKNELLKTALALGTVVKEGEYYKTTTTDLQGKTSDAFDATKSFNDSLSHQWMTTEVLVQTLGRYSDETTELGKKAFAAAQDVKTFTQLMDTLKEAVGSGWATTWETLFGDFNEAKALWTDVSNAVGGFIDAQSDARNALLSGGLSSGWKQLLGQGISDAQGFEESIREVAKEQGIAVDEMIESAGSFQQSLEKGWVTSDILSTAISRLADKTRGLSDEELLNTGHTRAEVDALEALEKSVRRGSVSMGEFAEKMAKASGRENLIQALKNAFSGLASVVKPIAEAFTEIFPPLTADRLYRMTEALREFTAKLKLSDEASANLKRTFKGVFAVLDILKQAFSAVYAAIRPLFGGLTSLSGSILGVTAGWGDWLVQLNETIRKNDTFNKAIQRTIGFISQAIEKVKSFAKTLQEKLHLPDFETVKGSLKEFVAFLQTNFKMPSLEQLQGLLEKIRERLEQLKDAAKSMKDGVVSAFSGMGDSLKNAKFLTVLGGVYQVVKTIASGIIKAVGAVYSAITEKLANADFSGIFDILNGLSIGGLILGVQKVMNSLSNSLKEFSGIAENISGVLDSVRGCFEAYQNKLKADVLMTIAAAIAILAASIIALSFVDSGRLTAATGAITVLFADLVLAMERLNKFGGGSKQTTKIAAAMVEMSAAVLIMASALKTLSGLNGEEMTVGVAGIAGLTATLVAAAKVMSNNEKTVIKGAASMVALSAAVKILASACLSLSSLSWSELGVGLAGVGGLLAELVIFLRTAEFDGKTLSTAAGIVVLSAAIKILASACRDFSTMKWEELGIGLTAIGSLLAELALFTNLTGNAKHVLSTGAALVLIAASMKIFASAIGEFGEMQWGEIARGLTAMGGALAAVTIAVNLMPKNLIGIGAGLIIVAGAMDILAGALVKMGGLTWEQVGVGLTAMGGALAELAIALNFMNGTLSGSAALLVASAALAVFAPVLNTLGEMGWEAIAKGLVALGGALAELAIALNLMNGTLAGSAALLIASAAIAVLAPALLLLGTLSWEAIAKGLVTIAASFTILGVAGALLSPLTPAILGLAAAFALIGVGILAAGAGLIAAGAGMSAMAVGWTAMAAASATGTAAVVAALTTIIKAVADLIPYIIARLGEGIIELCKVLIDGTPALAEAVNALILGLIDVLVTCIPPLVDGALLLVTEVLEAIVRYTPRIVDALLQFLVEIFRGIARNLPDVISAAMEAIMSLFIGIAEAMEQIDSGVLLKGIAGIGLIAALMAALGGLATLAPAALLGVLGLAGVAAEMGLVMTNLSKAMDNAKPFLESAKKIDQASMQGVKALAEIILILTAAGILEGLTSWLTGGTSMADFGKELAEFGPYFNAYYNAVKEIDGKVVETSANAAKSLAELANNLPNQGGVAGWFLGDNTLSDFGRELESFGPHFNAYYQSIRGVDSAVVEASANSARTLSEMAANLPNQGGLLSWFTGDNTLTVFGQELESFGPSLKAYADSVKGVDGDVVMNSANGAKALAELANNLPNQGGLFSWFTGNQDMSDFGKGLVSFGESFSAYARTMKKLDTGVLSATTSAARSIVELQNSLPKSGGWFSDETTLSTFGGNLAAFGGYFSSYYDMVRGVNVKQLASVIDETAHLIKMTQGMGTLDANAISKFGYALSDLASTGVDGFIAAFTNAVPRVQESATGMLTKFVEAAKSQQTKIVTTFTGLVQAALTAMNNKKTIFQSTGQGLVVSLVGGMKTVSNTVVSAFSQMVSDGLIAVRSKYSDFRSAGGYLVQGFAAGISENTYLARAKASAMAAAAADAAAEELDEHSPSKVGYRIGDFFGVAFVNALDDYSQKAYAAGSGIAQSAREGLNKSAANLADRIADTMDAQPTIRPVLDLSDVESKAGRLNALFTRNKALAISAEMSEGEDCGVQNVGTHSGNTYQFTQNNYSPKALSRLEIYRQTKNQFSAMKGLVET